MNPIRRHATLHGHNPSLEGQRRLSYLLPRRKAVSVDRQLSRVPTHFPSAQHLSARHKMALDFGTWLPGYHANSGSAGFWLILILDRYTQTKFN